MVKAAEAYRLAQNAVADLKSAVHTILSGAPDDGLSNAAIGRTLGIYIGYNGQQEGHIPRTILGLMEHEEVVEQMPKTKKWKLKKQINEQEDLCRTSS